MEYTSTVTFESKVVPGVKYALRKMSHGRRIDLNMKLADVSAELSALESRMQSVSEEIDRAISAAKIEPCTCDGCADKPTPEGINPEILDDTRHIAASGQCPIAGCRCREPKPNPEVGTFEDLLRMRRDHTELVVNKLYPVYIRWGVAGIEGLTIDGAPATVDDLLSKCAEVLVGELGIEIRRLINLNPEEVLGFKLPSTSGAQTDGQTPSTSAPTASK